MKDFGTAVSNFRQDFQTKGPFASNYPPEKAFKVIKEYPSFSVSQ